MSLQFRRWSLWHYYLIYVVVTAMAFLLILLFAKQLFKNFYIEQLTTSINQQISSFVSQPHFEPDCVDLAKRLSATVGIYKGDGEVLCSSGTADGLAIDKNLIEYAQQNKLPNSDILSNELPGAKFMLFVHFPSNAAGETVYLVYPLRLAYDLINQVIFKLLLVVLAAITIIIALGFYMYRHINPPLEEMRRGAEGFAKGDFSKSLRKYQIVEVDSLSISLNKMARQLDRLDKVRRDFIANVSHELRTPITSINGFVETLLDGAIDDPENARRFLKIVKKQSQRLTSIIVDLLTLARLEDERTKETLLLQEEYLSDVLLSVVEMCKPQADKQEIVFEVSAQEGLSAVIDRSLVVQAMSNLVENAIKYSGEGKTIFLSAKLDNRDRVLLSVHDQGIGISKQHLNRLFERFYRVDRARSREFGGTGLGLAIVKHIAQVHRGIVTVESEVGRGSCFTIELPKRDVSAEG